MVSVSASSEVEWRVVVVSKLEVGLGSELRRMVREVKWLDNRE